jgi:hypothetical protein
MKRFLLNLSICLVIAISSIAMIGCFGKKEEPVTETPTVEEETATTEEAETSEAGKEG